MDRLIQINAQDTSTVIAGCRRPTLGNRPDQAMMPTPGMKARMLRLLGILGMVALVLLGRAGPVGAEAREVHGPAAIRISTMTFGPVRQDENSFDARHRNCLGCPAGSINAGPAAVLTWSCAMPQADGAAARWLHRDDRGVRASLLKRDPPVPRRIL